MQVWGVFPRVRGEEGDGGRKRGRFQRIRKMTVKALVDHYNRRTEVQRGAIYSGAGKGSRESKGGGES